MIKVPSPDVTGNEKPPMPVSHARTATVTSADENARDEIPRLLEVLAQVPDPRKRRGRRFSMVFMLAVAVACVLAGAKNFREIGDQAADLPQEILARLGGRPHPLRRTIIAPSEKRIRTLTQAVDARRLDELTGTWLRALAQAGRLQNLLTAIAIDGKWLRGIGDGQQVKLFAAMLHQEKVIIAQHAIQEDTNEITQVRQLLDPVDLENAVVTGDAAHAQRDTAAYIAGPEEQSGRGSDYLLVVKATSPACSAPSTTPSRNNAPAARTTASWTTGTAASSSAPSGSPTPQTWTSRTHPRSCGSAATATMPPARRSPRKSCTP